MYRQAGVNLEAGYESVRRIHAHVERTKTKGAQNAFGGFGGAFDLSSLHLKEPVLVSGTDGVGTKLILAKMYDKHDTIGIDAVAMCVNDVLVQGALPIYFLDYIAVGKNNPSQVEQIVKGVADGCILSECALIGGETAEMPDMYNEDEYDLAGFCVGAVEKAKFIDGSKVTSGQALIGIASSGCHSNGYSLIRKILLKDANLDLHQIYEPMCRPLGEELLIPTKIYVKAIKALLNQIDIKGMAHITGGGFYENIPRMLKPGQGAKIDTTIYPVPPIFDFIKKTGKISKEEMYNVFNMGIGFVLAVEQHDVTKTLEILQAVGEKAYMIGTITDTAEVEITW